MCLLTAGCHPSLQGNTVESEHLSELTEEEYEAHYVRRQDLKGFLWLDAKYLNPFFTRRLTQEVGHRPGSLAFLPQDPQWPRAGWAGRARAERSAVSPSRARGPSGPVELGICCFSSSSRFSASSVIDLLTRFSFPGG